MKRIYILLLILITLTSRIQASQQDSNVKYFIDDVEVSKKIFNTKLDNLKVFDDSCICAETTTGGVTWCEYIDKFGKLYQCECISEPNNNQCILTCMTTNMPD